MSDQPPGPPAGAPPRLPSLTPQLFMTPQLQKRRDGLCPSLLDLSTSDGGGASSSEGSSLESKSYRTASSFLNATFHKEDKDATENRVALGDSTELQNVVDSIQNTLDGLTATDGSQDISKIAFEPKGCVWTLTLNPELRAQAFQLQVICKACAREEGGNWYLVETKLVPQGIDPVRTSDPKYRLAKEIFDVTALQVRKAVVRCEFPEFPEGCKGRPFREVYQLNARLKSGSFATVCRGTHRATGKKVAIKCVLRKDLPASDDAAIYDEVAILASLEHRHIVPLIDFFDEKDCYFLVMELMSGGDLFDRIGKKKVYSEDDARNLILKMLQAMAYCHERDIAHCDMKPKNLLLASEEDDSFIKLADFGFAARVHEPKSLTKQCGTPFFVSPEILMRHKYDQMTDMWSCGCIAFLLLGGNLPFLGRSQKELFKKIVVGKYEFDEDWDEVSEDAKDLVTKLLVTDPDERLSASDALKHKWLNESRQRLSLKRLQGTSTRLKTFNARMKLRSAMIGVTWVSSLSIASSITRMNRNSSAGSGTSLETAEAEDKFAQLQLEDDGLGELGSTDVKVKRESIVEADESEEEA